MKAFPVYLSDELVANEPDISKWIEAIQMLANRMSFSGPKYGMMRDKYPECAHAIDNAKARSELYELFGNTEDCLDAANFHIIEHIFPSHPKAHFRPRSSNEVDFRWKEEKEKE